jgi:hypothetical protein
MKCIINHVHVSRPPFGIRLSVDGSRRAKHPDLSLPHLVQIDAAVAALHIDLRTISLID